MACSPPASSSSSSSPSLSCPRQSRNKGHGCLVLLQGLLLALPLLLAAPPAAASRPLSEHVLRMRRFLTRFLPTQQQQVQQGSPSGGFVSPRGVFTSSSTQGSAEAGFVLMDQSPGSTYLAPAPASLPTPCPPRVSECDFFFQGFESQVPQFNATGAAPDTPLSPPLMTSVSPSISVGAVNTQVAQYICSHPTPPSDNQFYITNSRLQARTFNGNSAALLSKQYVKLQITSAQLLTTVQNTSSTMNLNPGDGDIQFPQDRRCVVFQT